MILDTASINKMFHLFSKYKLWLAQPSFKKGGKVPWKITQNNPSCILRYTNFIENNPIQIPHRYSNAQDIEIAAFLTSTIAWGRRDMIIKSANRIMELMDDSPADFVMNSAELRLNSTHLNATISALGGADTHMATD